MYLTWNHPSWMGIPLNSPTYHRCKNFKILKGIKCSVDCAMIYQQIHFCHGVFKFKKCKINVPSDLHSIGIIYNLISNTVGHLTHLWNFSQYIFDHLWDEDLNEMVLSTLVCLRCVHHYCNFCFTICKDSLWKNEEKVCIVYYKWYLCDFLK